MLCDCEVSAIAPSIGHRRPALRSARAHFERARGDKQGGSARRLPRPHLGRGATPSNYVFERHA